MVQHNQEEDWNHRHRDCVRPSLAIRPRFLSAPFRGELDEKGTERDEPHIEEEDGEAM